MLNVLKRLVTALVFKQPSSVSRTAPGGALVT
jgi:hypothetical protein